MKCKCRWCTSLRCRECMGCQTCPHKCRICHKCSKCSNKYLNSTSSRCNLWWMVWWCLKTKWAWILTCSRCHRLWLRCHRWNKAHSFLWCQCSNLLIRSSSKANKMFMWAVFQKKSLSWRRNKRNRKSKHKSHRECLREWEEEGLRIQLTYKLKTL